MEHKQPPICSFTRSLPRLTHLSSELAPGTYNEIELVRTTWGVGTQGRYSVQIKCQGEIVATVNSYSQDVTWHVYGLSMHIHLMKVLTKGLNICTQAKDEKKCAAREEQIQSEYNKAVKLHAVADSYERDT